MTRTIGRNKGDRDGELTELGNWSKKARNAKGGFVTHPVRNSGIIKSCGHEMGSGCGCKYVGVKI